MLKTRLTEMFGIEHPIIQAGMGGVARWELTVAVSNAGGLGVLGAALMHPEDMRKEILQIKEHTDKPYGVDLLIAEGTPDVEELMAVLYEEDVPIFVSGLGDPGRWANEMHERGMKIVALVGNTRQAIRCAESGVDLIVAQGHEAGGHTGKIPTFIIVPQVVDAVSPVPVVAAGGIGDGRGLAAALMLGAEGVLVGTRFIATQEARTHINVKDKLVEITEEGTVVTRAYTGKTCRVIRNKHTDEWQLKEDEIQRYPMQLGVIGDRAISANLKGDMDYGLAPAGQISGMIQDIPSAADVVERIVHEAEQLLSEIPDRTLT
ncbi:MAG: nitronate monooxygenase [Candidatus Hydrogenedentes bacterium]|nr:nitronate monooxygenase [Candidatus Hydrogenedentota bacterium]